jgi:GT2 family glycosyltransferase
MPNDADQSPFLVALDESQVNLVSTNPDVSGRGRTAFLQAAASTGADEYGHDQNVATSSVAWATANGCPGHSYERLAGAAVSASPASTRARCTVIVPVYGKAALTRRCLDTLLSQPPYGFEREIVVVDDASPDATPKLLADYSNRVHVVTHTVSSGFATACNDGGAAARGDYLVFLNNDAVLQAGWLEALVRYADDNSRAAVVGCKQLFPDDTVRHAGVVICQDGWPAHIYAGFPADHPAVNKSRRFQVVTAGCVLVRRELFRELGGFDPGFRYGFEEVDLCLRLGQRGYDVHYCHESVVYRFESDSDGHQLNTNHQDELYRSRWRGRVRPDDLDYYVEDELLRLEYSDMFPVKLVVSPLLALVGGEEAQCQADRLLRDRARQVYELLGENVRLSVRVQEAELRAAVAGRGALPPLAEAPMRWLEPGPPSTKVPASRQEDSGPSETHGPGRSLDGSAAPTPFAPGQGDWWTPRQRNATSDCTQPCIHDQPMRRCTVIIPVYNKVALTRRCLETLFSQPPQGFEREIVVVDDHSTDATPQLLTGYGDRLRVVTHAVNAGFATACNDGAAGARGDYLVFLNNDTVPQTGWLEALVRYAVGHPRAAAVGCKLLYPDDTIQHAGVVVRPNRELVHIYRGFPRDHPAVNKSRRFQVVTAGCVLVRRELFEEAGGFDTRFRNSYEDVDLCLRLGERGYEVHYCHECVVYHLESVSDGRYSYTAQNSQLYQSRWQHRVQPDDLKYYVEDGLLRVCYQPLTPIYIGVSPLLAVTSDDNSRRQASGLLRCRADQVYELLRENIHLSVRIQEAEFRAALAAGSDTASGARREDPIAAGRS